MGTRDENKPKKKTKKAKVRLYEKKLRGESEKAAIEKLIERYSQVSWFYALQIINKLINIQ